MIRRCNCRHKDQDKRYGEGMRVHNRAKNTSTGSMTDKRCTVCGTKKVK